MQHNRQYRVAVNTQILAKSTVEEGVMGRKAEQLYQDLTVIMTQIEDKDDPREALAIVQSRIREYRSAGWAVPDDLARVERHLMTEFMAESQGR